jgi:hypothetical protein
MSIHRYLKVGMSPLSPHQSAAADIWSRSQLSKPPGFAAESDLDECIACSHQLRSGIASGK